MAEMTLIRAKTLPTSSELTQRLIRARLPTVHTGVNEAITNPRIKIQDCPLNIAGKLQPIGRRKHSLV